MPKRVTLVLSGSLDRRIRQVMRARQRTRKQIVLCCLRDGLYLLENKLNLHASDGRA